jgi:hypothetical protein
MKLRLRKEMKYEFLRFPSGKIIYHYYKVPSKLAIRIMILISTMALIAVLVVL